MSKGMTTLVIMVRREKILEHLAKGPATTDELREVIRDTKPVVYKTLVQMMELGLIQGSRVKLGPGIKRRWRLTPRTSTRDEA